MVRGERWKYIRHDDGVEYLYGLDADPGETENLTDDDAYRDTKSELKAVLDQWLDDSDFPYDPW